MSYSILTLNNSKKISYKQHKSDNDIMPTVVFLHGLLSDQNGLKATYLEKYALQNGYGFLSFDNLGHGNSTGKFEEQTITSWLETASYMVNHLAGDNFILVGSSKGAWLALLLAINKLCKGVRGLTLLAPAPDFTESIWLSLSIDQQHMMQSQDVYPYCKPGSSFVYPISYNLILDAKKYLLLEQPYIVLDVPTTIIHGMQDTDVSYQVSLNLMHKIESPYLSTKILKNSNHSLSSDIDLKVISNSIEELIIAT